MENKPYRVGITEKYIKEVIIFAEDPAAAEELAEDLCNRAVIDIDYDNFVSRDTESWGQAQLPTDMQIFEAYGDRKHICDVQKGDVLIHEGRLYTAMKDSFLSSTDHGEEWTVQLEGKDPELFVYASYFPEGMVDIAQPALERENELDALSDDHAQPEAQEGTTEPGTDHTPRAMLSELIQAARDQLEEKGSTEHLHYDFSDTLITYGDAPGSKNNLTVCSTNPVGIDPMTFNAQTIVTCGTDGKDAVMNRHKQKLDQMNLQLGASKTSYDKNDPLPEI